jgi:hypothetical protein
MYTTGVHANARAVRIESRLPIFFKVRPKNAIPIPLRNAVVMLKNTGCLFQKNEYVISCSGFPGNRDAIYSCLAEMTCEEFATLHASGSMPYPASMKGTLERKTTAAIIQKHVLSFIILTSIKAFAFILQASDA